MPLDKQDNSARGASDSSGNLYLTLAGVLCVLALAAKLMMNRTDIAGGLLVLAAGLLVYGFVEKSKTTRTTTQNIELTPEQRSTIAEMKDRGDKNTAIKQIQLWYRDASAQQAIDVYEDL